ncbi:MAG: hypothetical protein U0L77_05870, partial [Prevotellamassilia sp.]|nr:hypothetical protein [Prevotellamassilia sp.]
LKKIIRHLFFTRCRIIFAKTGVFLESFQKLHTDNQALKKEVLPIWVTPPFLQCKDNTFLSEMQIDFFTSRALLCEKC